VKLTLLISEFSETNGFYPLQGYHLDSNNESR